MLYRILSSAVLMLFGFISESWLGELPVKILFLAAFVVIGYEVVLNSVKNILRGEVFDECFLMTIASIGAFVIGEFPEAAAVMLFYNIGEYFSDIASEKSRLSISKLLDLRPDSVNIMVDGELISEKPEKIGIGTSIFVKTGERVPIDGVVKSGNSSLDMSSLTGESVPVDVSEGSNILSGSVNLQGL
jgi:Cd2+/Zn2+-exporting ATPase